MARFQKFCDMGLYIRFKSLGWAGDVGNLEQGTVTAIGPTEAGCLFLRIIVALFTPSNENICI